MSERCAFCGEVVGIPGELKICDRCIELLTTTISRVTKERDELTNFGTKPEWEVQAEMEPEDPETDNE